MVNLTNCIKVFISASMFTLANAQTQENINQNTQVNTESKIVQYDSYKLITPKNQSLLKAFTNAAIKTYPIMFYASKVNTSTSTEETDTFELWVVIGEANSINSIAHETNRDSLLSAVNNGKIELANGNMSTTPTLTKEKWLLLKIFQYKKSLFTSTNIKKAGIATIAINDDDRNGWVVKSTSKPFDE